MPEYKIYEEWPNVFVVKRRYGNSSFYDAVYRTDTLQNALHYVNSGPWPKEYDLAGNFVTTN